MHHVPDVPNYRAVYALQPAKGEKVEAMLFADGGSRGNPGPAAGGAVLLLGCVTLWLGPAWAVIMMGFVFGLGHAGLGTILLVNEHRENAIRLHRSVA